MTTLHVSKKGMSQAAKQAAIAAALPKLEKLVSQDKKGKQPHPEMLKGPAIKDKVPADIDYTGYGKQMAVNYLTSLGAAAATWQDQVLHLLKTADDKARAKALTAATWVAKECKDDTAKKSLLKRITEARRVFKAATIKGHAKVVKTLESAGSWHQKVAKMPKQSNAGRKPKPVDVAGAMASVEAAGKANMLPGMSGHTKVVAVKLGDVFGMVERLSIPDCLKVLDLCAGRIMTCKEPNFAALGKEVTQLREKQDAAIKLAA